MTSSDKIEVGTANYVFFTQRHKNAVKELNKTKLILMGKLSEHYGIDTDVMKYSRMNYTESQQICLLKEELHVCVLQLEFVNNLERTLDLQNAVFSHAQDNPEEAEKILDSLTTPGTGQDQIIQQPKAHQANDD